MYQHFAYFLLYLNHLNHHLKIHHTPNDQLLQKISCYYYYLSIYIIMIIVYINTKIMTIHCGGNIQNQSTSGNLSISGDVVVSGLENTDEIDSYTPSHGVLIDGLNNT